MKDNIQIGMNRFLGIARNKKVIAAYLMVGSLAVVDTYVCNFKYVHAINEYLNKIVGY